MTVAFALDIIAGVSQLRGASHSSLGAINFMQMHNVKKKGTELNQ